MKIAVVSDTHGRLSPAAEESIFSCDAVLHAGDFDDEDMYRRFNRRLVPFLGVRGNCDSWAWGGSLKDSVYTEYEGVRIFMTHRPQDVYRLCRREADIIICGHTHCHEEITTDGMFRLNPGSISRPRDGQAGYVILHVSNGSYETEYVPAESIRPAVSAKDQMPDDMLIRRTVKLTDRGLPVPEIAAKLGASPVLIDRIVRMYLTHPGIDVDGILARIYGS
ncbi:MAG: YfcE family phosphodiesterase [Lachnospiraceae bacterium]|nr:YfcE family phosphodiesterase [Lachnospiraceae bacterium]